MSSQQMVQLVHKLRTASRISTDTFSKINIKIKNYEMPERFKGTFLERWAKYWHNLYIDYRDVAIDVAKDCKKHPIRATIYTTLLGCSLYSSIHNPGEISFRDNMIKYNLKLMLLGEPIRNPVAVKHIEQLQQYYNEGIIRRINLGISSLMWVDNYDEKCSLYKAVCPYLKPRYVTFYNRIVDIGFLDKWWVLENKMKDYDVNEAEFNNFTKQSIDTA
ncbi:mitochondrial import inner membrane translocase subunit Tim29 [Odontomachus brunneus]|uniref:mitochondrial import inner membrane translocase subunit Tim29 n=1 Tax=Odontomachus brunneus TaxID=486640 RepID=UPI0013F2043F|nr:mitochondrial import inner membrane translocase subunit Tim29 [Odontomachus brunneus]XP_032683481.1 mitochondrial import inner membrane translocase subunit Tim29 [Odontomachus brunneus]